MNRSLVGGRITFIMQPEHLRFLKCFCVIQPLLMQGRKQGGALLTSFPSCVGIEWESLAFGYVKKRGEKGFYKRGLLFALSEMAVRPARMLACTHRQIWLWKGEQMSHAAGNGIWSFALDRGKMKFRVKVSTW